MTDPTTPTSDRKADRLDPQVKKIEEIQDARNFPEPDTLEPETQREHWESLTADASDRIDTDIEETADFAIEGPDEPLPVRAYFPGDDGPYPVVVFYHGGGFVWGSIDTHDNVCRVLCDEADSLVLSVDYRLAPEHPFPAALNDAYAALEWATASVGDMGGDPDRLAVAGDSAGGNLAAGVSLLARDKNEAPDIARQVHIYSSLNWGGLLDYPSYEENDQPNLDADFSVRHMSYYPAVSDYYLTDEVHRGNIYCAPLLANDLSDLPPATVLTAGFDTLRDEGFEYAKRLQDAGVETRLENYEAMNHGFVNLLGLVDRAHDAIDVIAGDLAAAFESEDAE
jgi:acetyl esterase